MKRNLLFSVALLSGAAIVSASSPAVEKMEPNLNNTVVKRATVTALAPVLSSPKAVKANKIALVPGKLNLPKAAAGTASFAAPNGYYYYGLCQGDASDGITWAGSSFFGPAYHSDTWQSTTEGASAYEWEYMDPAWDGKTEPSYLYSESQNLEAPAYPSNTWYAPALTATIGGQTTEKYQPVTLMQLGGEPYVWFQSDAEPTYLTFTDFDLPAYLGTTKPYNMSASLNFGVTEGNSEIWSKVVNEEVNITSVGKYFPAPAIPYVLSGVYVPAVIEKFGSDRITVKVWKCNDSGYLEEVVATGYLAKADVPVSAENYTPFTVPLIESIDGMESIKYLDVDYPILIEVGGFDESKDSFGTVFTYSSDMNDAKICTSYVGGTDADGNVTFLSAANVYFGEDGSERYPVNFGIGAVGMYTWLYATDDNYSLSVPADGGSATIKINSYLGGESALSFTGWGVYDWIQPTVGEFDASTGETEITFDVDPISADYGYNGRTCAIKVSIPGASKVFTLVQGEAGVNAVEGTDNKVAVVDGNFEVTAAKAGVVEVYNIAGQKVASAQVDGTAVVSAQNLAKGLYVVKFADNSVVKVMK